MQSVQTRQERTRRSFYEIAALIVSAASPERKTRLMYASRLNLDVLNKYLRFLTEYALLSNDKLSKTYRATPRGLRYLKAYQDYVAAKEHFKDKEKVMRSFLTKAIAESSQSFAAVE
jgi:predicted transcriptional regulator